MAVSFSITRTTTRFHDSNGNGVKDAGEQDFDSGEIGVYDPGDILYTRINITNTGNDPATGVTIQDLTSGTTPVANPNDPADLSFINISPIASNDTFTAVGNTVLRVGTANSISGGESTFFAGNLTSNDVGSLTGDDVPGFQIDAVTNGVTAKGGTFNIFSDGTFNYLNDAADTDAELSAGDSFTYKIRDAGMDGTYGTADDLTSTATVTITFSTQSGVPGTAVNRVWYVDGAKNTDGNGTSANPFQSSQIASKLSGAGDSDADGHIIYVESTASGSITLEANQKLIGAGEELTVGGFAIAADSGGNSALNATSGFAVTLSTGNTVAGINLGGTGGISGTSFGTLTVTDDVVLNTSGTALSLTTGAFAGTGFASTTSTGGLQNVLLSGVSGTVNLGSGALSGATGILPTEGNLVVIGGSANVNYSGTIGQGTADVAALNVRGAHSGTINLTGNITVTEGLGLQFTDADGTYNLTGVISLTGAGDAGIGIVSGSNGTFAFGTASNLATVTNNSGGDAFVVTNSNANVTFNGTITDNNGNAVNIDGHDGGAITFQNGSINSTGSGIDVANSNGGAINFNSQITLSTGASTGIILINNNGSTTNFNPTGSGLDITTSTGSGFIATNGGTITIADSGTGNSLNVTAGIGGAVGFSATGGTTFGAGGVIFDTVSVNGGTNGIVLNGTGSTAGMRILGTGSVDSGGTIKNMSGDGISLTNTEDFRASWMNISDNAGNGLGGTNVHGLVLDRIKFSSNGDNASDDDSGIDIVGLTGTASNGSRPTAITNSTFDNNYEFEVQISNASGTLTNFQFLNNTITSNGADVIGNLVNFLGTGTSLMGIKATGNTFTGSAPATATGLHIDSSGTSMTAIVQNNTFTNNNVGVSVSTGPGSTTLTYLIDNNTITGSRAHAINEFHNANSPHNRTVNGTISNNTIGTSGVVGSGSATGNGIRVQNEGAVGGNWLIHNNTIREIGTAPGSGTSAISIVSGLTGIGTGGGTMNVTLTENDMFDIRNGRGIVVQALQSGGSSFPTIHTDITGNTFTNVAGQAGDGSYMRFNALTGNAIRIEQAQHTAAANPAELDDANGFNDPTKISVGGTGLTTYNQGDPPNPTTPTLAILAEAPPEPQAPAAVPEESAPTLGGGSGDTPPVGSEVAAGPVVVDDGILSQAELDLILEAAIQRWVAAGASEEQVAAMRAVKVSVADLAGLTLGQSGFGEIVLDSNAAGWNWFIDSTPGDDSEYAGSGSRLLAADKLGAAGTRIDLLTVLTHELGHQIGLSDSYVPGDSDELMFGTIGAGERRLPGSDDLDHAGDSPVAGAFAFAPITLGTIPAGQTVVVEYQQTINIPSEDGLVGSWTGQSIVDSDQTLEVLSNAESGNIDGLALGDRIFNDNNKNGLYDAGDSTFGGVVLTLYADTNNDGDYDEGVDLYVGYNEVNGVPGYQQGVDTPAAAGTGTALKATTNATGHYSFSSLAPGDYIVRVDASNFQSGGALFGKVSTPGVKNPNDTNADGVSAVVAPADVNVDNDDNGEQFLIGQAGTYAASRAIRLDYGQETVAGPTGPALDTNNSLDLAFFAPNAAPVIGAVTGDAQTYYENGAPIAIDLGGNATVTDGDSANFDGGSLTVSWNGSSGDRLTFGSGTSFDGNNDVFVGATKIGTLSTSANQIVISFNANATPANVQTLIRAFQFDVNGNTPTAGVRTFTFTLVDGDGNDGGLGNDTGTATATITVVPVSDAPEGADRTGTGLQDSTGAAYAFTVADFATGFADPNDSPANSFSAVKITTLPAAAAGTIYYDSNLADATPGVAIAAGDVFTAQDLTDGKLTFVGAPGSGGMAMSFTFQVIDNGSTDNGGVVMDGSANTFSTTIVAGNAAPVLDLDGDDSSAPATPGGFKGSYTEGGAAASVGDSDVTITDADSGDDIVSATITITNPESGDKLDVGSLPSTVTKDSSSTDTMVKLVAAPGTSRADFEAAIKAVTFSNTGNDPTDKGTNLSRSISVVVNDGNADSNTATATIAVTDVNDAPTGTSSTITSVEDAPRMLKAVDFGFNDADGTFGGVTISGVTGGKIYFDADGTVGPDPAVEATLPQTFTAQDLIDNKVYFQASLNANGAGIGSITFTVKDDDGASAASANTLTVNVTAINDKPDLSSSPSAISAVEQTPVAILAGITVSDADLDAKEGGTGNYKGSSFSVNRNPASNSEDDFTLVAGPNFSIDGINLKTTGGQIFGYINADSNGLISITFTSLEAIATSALVDEVIQSIRYTNTSNNPPASVTLAYGFVDGAPGEGQGAYPGGGNLDVELVTVEIAGVNDAPVNSLGATIGVNEDAVDAWLSGMSISDPDVDPATEGILVTFEVANGTLKIRTDVAGGIVAGDITNQEAGTITVLATLNKINATLAAANGLTYTPNANFNGDDTLTVTTNDRGWDGTDPDLTGDHISEEDVDTRTISVGAQPDAPIAQPDAVSTAENVVGTGSLLANNGSGPDSDADGDPITVSHVNGNPVVDGQPIVLASGAILVVNSDGTYSYNPNGKFNTLTDNSSGAVNTSTVGDTFQYTVTGGNTVTVTVTVNGVAGPGDELRGNSGDNTINGTPDGDLFLVHQGGDDTTNGLGGNDSFYFGAALSAGDVIDGGSGTRDQLGLQGNYGTFGAGATAFTLGSNHLVNIEMLVLLSGADSRFGDTSGSFYGYNIATLDLHVAAGQQFVVSFNTLRAGENVTFDGSAETDGSFMTYGGLGTDILTGGQQNDAFYFGADGRFGAGDRVDGQGGSLDQLGLQGDYSGARAVTFAANSMTGIEMIVLLSAGDNRFGGGSEDGFSYDIVMNDANVAAGARMYISANTLRSDGTLDETLDFDGSAEKDGFFTVYAGSGADTLVGGAGADDIWGRGGADRITGGLGADILRGGEGEDVFDYNSADESDLASMDSILDFTSGSDKIDLSGIDADSLTGGDQAFSFIGSNAFSGNGAAGQLRAYQDGANWIVEGDTDGDGNADLIIQVTVTGTPIVQSDFIL